MFPWVRRPARFDKLLRRSHSVDVSGNGRETRPGKGGPRFAGEDSAVRSRRTLGGQIACTFTSSSVPARGRAGRRRAARRRRHSCSACGDDDDDSSTSGSGRRRQRVRRAGRPAVVDQEHRVRRPVRGRQQGLLHRRGLQLAEPDPRPRRRHRPARGGRRPRTRSAGPRRVANAVLNDDAPAQGHRRQLPEEPLLHPLPGRRPARRRPRRCGARPSACRPANEQIWQALLRANGLEEGDGPDQVKQGAGRLRADAARERRGARASSASSPTSPTSCASRASTSARSTCPTSASRCTSRSTPSPRSRSRPSGTSSSPPCGPSRRAGSTPSPTTSWPST